jgi:hypothetical protein
MNEVKRRTVDIDIDEHEGRTRAIARLHTRDTDHLVAAGTARLNPAERDVPEIGDEPAAARALSGLAHALLDAVVGDIDPIAGTPSTRLRL